MSDQLYHLYPSDLTNRQWQNIKEHIPAAKSGGRPRTLDMRLVLNAIFYVLVGGIQWRMLPREYPNWKSVYHYFRLWRKDGTWQRLHDTLRAKARRQVGKHKHPTAGCLDSQSVKCSHISQMLAHQRQTGLRQRQKGQRAQAPHPRRHSGIAHGRAGHRR